MTTSGEHGLVFTVADISGGSRRESEAMGERIRRRMITFSLVQQGLGGSRDPIGALSPFFIPIANDQGNRPFDAGDFCNEMRSRYGICLSRDVTEFFVQRLIAMGFLRRTDGRSDLLWVQQGGVPEQARESVDQLDAVIEAAAALHAVRQDLLNEPFTEDRFLSALMKVLLNQNPVLQSAVKTLETANGSIGENGRSGMRLRGGDEYFASEFVRWCATERKDLFAWLADLAGTAMVAEALIEIRTPQPNQHVRKELVVYLDAPFLMELLGCSGSASHEDAKFIVDTLQSQRIPVVVLSHSISELQGNLKGVLALSPVDRTGPTAKALLFKEVAEEYLHSVLSTPLYFIEQLKINVVDPARLPRSEMDVLSSADRQSLYGKLYGIHDNELAQERDTISIAFVIRRRNGGFSRDVLLSRHILLTRNPLLVRYAKDFVVEHCDAPFNAAGPAVLAREMAGVLWHLVGQQERQELSKRQLILNCDRVRASAPEIVAAMFNTAKNLTPQNAQLFRVAMEKPRYLTMALDAVVGMAGEVNRDATEKTLEKIREDLIRDERKISSDKIEREREKFDSERALQEIVNHSLQQERDFLANEKDSLLNKLKSISSEVWEKHSRNATIVYHIGVATFYLLIFIFTFTLSIVGSDLLNIGPMWRITVPTLLTLVLFFAGRKNIAVWLRSAIGGRYTASYKAEIRYLAGDYYDNVVLSAPILGPNVNPNISG